MFILATTTMVEEMEHTGPPKCHLSLYSSIVQDLDSSVTPKEQSRMSYRLWYIKTWREQ